MPKSIEKQALDRIHGSKRGAVFTPGSFLDLGSRQAVDLILHRLVERGVLRRLARGLYDYPRQDPELGALAPDIDRVAKALVGKDRIRLQPSGAYAANLLHLSEQVPARVVFLTDGANRKVQIGRQTIELRRTTPRNMAAAGKISGLVIQAFRHLGQKHVDKTHVARLKSGLSMEEKKQLIKDLPLAPAWMHPLFREIADEA